MRMEPDMKWRLCKEGRNSYYIIPPENIIKKCGLGFQFKVFGEKWRDYLKTKNVSFSADGRFYTIREDEEVAKEILSTLNSMWKRKLIEKINQKG